MDYLIRSGTVSSGIELNDDIMTVYNGGVASNNTVNWGYMENLQWRHCEQYQC